jgi:hypothetical protein
MSVRNHVDCTKMRYIKWASIPLLIIGYGLTAELGGLGFILFLIVLALAWLGAVYLDGRG